MSDLEARLRAIGEERYHAKHPFHALLHGGKLNRGQVQAWALNRYYYQSRIPIKDAALIARTNDSEIRRLWRQRLVDHDGEAPGDGGVARWLKLCEGVGLRREDVIAEKGILPATRFAVDAYVNYVRDRTLLEAIASSLTEMFSPQIISNRVAGMLANYDWIGKETLAYFNARLTQAPRDAEWALAYVTRNATTPELQDAVANALIFKCNVLWAQLDALYLAYVDPGLIPPDGFVPEG